ncbi:MAG: S41 family peptidase [Acidimicrobiales bacterium]
MLTQPPTLRSEALTPVRPGRGAGARLLPGLRRPQAPSPRTAICLLLALALAVTGATAAGHLPGLGGARPGPAGRAEGRAAMLEILEAHHYRPFDAAPLSDAPVAAWSSLLDDPSTRLVPAADVAHRNAAEAAGHVGIGARLRATKDGTVELTAVTDGSPAANGGLRPGDQVLTVDGTAVSGLDVEAVTDLIEGPEGSVLAVSVIRPGAEVSVTVQRGTLKQGTVEARLRRWETGLVGVITVPELIPGAAVELRAAVDRLRSEGAEAFVLDLRRNPGGPMAEAVDAAAAFLPAGSAVATEVGRTRPTVTFRTSGAPLEAEAPLVVLVDDLTAGTAEVLTGALADNDRALVAGTITAGRSGLQERYLLPGGDALQTTYASYVTPLGRTLERNGIPPDVAPPTSPGHVTQPPPPDGSGDVALDVALRAAVSQLPRL